MEAALKKAQHHSFKPRQKSKHNPNLLIFQEMLLCLKRSVKEMTNKQIPKVLHLYLKRHIVLSKAVACIGKENQTPPPLQEFIVSITTTVKPVIKANCEELLFLISS